MRFSRITTKNIELPLKVSALLLILVNVFLSMWFVLNKTVLFNSDIGRDFLLMQEVLEKKIVLIGPRASGIEGMFHGPLWLYLNMPAFLVGGGNPLVVGWFWVFLNVLFLCSYYFILAKLFNKSSAIIATLIISFHTITFTHGLFNPHGAFYLVPVVFYLFISWYQSQDFRKLLLLIFTIGLTIQFQMAVGIPLFILCSIIVLYMIFKTKKYLHLFAFLIMVIPISTWILFDIRHEYVQTHAVIKNFTTVHEAVNWPVKILSLFKTMTGQGIHIFGNNVGQLNFLISLFIILISYRVYKKIDSDKRTTYLFLIYFYVGYWILTLLHKGDILYHYFFPMISIPIALFAVAISYNGTRRFFYLLVSAIILVNLTQTILSARHYQEFISYDESSWKTQHETGERVFADGDKEFGYFIFTPDQLGYSTKYALLYSQKVHQDQKSYPYEKKPLTYLVVAPPPKDIPSLNGDWWKTHQVKIKNPPHAIYKLPNSTRVMKIRLSKEDLSTPADPLLNSSITIR